MDSLSSDVQNIVVVSFGGPGDVHPMLSLGRALRKRGHRVLLLSNPYFESLARQLDLDFAGFGSVAHLVHSMQGAHGRSCDRGHSRALPGQWLWKGLNRWRRRTRGVLGPMRWTYEKIEREHAAGKTLVVARGNAFGARIAQEKLGIPLATVHLQPAMLRSEYDAPGLPLPDKNSPLFRPLRRYLWKAIDSYADSLLSPPTNAFRSELGLAPVRHLFSRWIHSPELVIGMFPDWFAQPQPDWPPCTHLVGFPIFDESGIREVPPKAELFLAAGEPPVVFTAGSFHRNAGRFFDVSARVCHSLGVRGLILSPADACVPSSLPEGVVHFPYIPLGSVLPRSAAVVHHGGIGTAGLAFAAGIPQMVVPFTDDQSDNAARVQRVGAGFTMSLAEYQLAAVAPRLKTLMSSREIANTCRSFALRFQSQEPLVEAVRLIEDLSGQVDGR